MAASILVVDDDGNIRELLRMHLSAAGYDVHVAQDAISAGYMVLRSPPDLIISDVNMPHMDGFEFIAAVRDDNSLPYIPVIFLTSEEEGEIGGKSLAQSVTSRSRSARTGCSIWWRSTCRAAGIAPGRVKAPGRSPRRSGACG